MGSDSCYGCTERHVGCQIDCDTYKRYRMKIDERKAREAKARHDRDVFHSYLREDKTRRIRRFGS